MHLSPTGTNSKNSKKIYSLEFILTTVNELGTMDTSKCNATVKLTVQIEDAFDSQVFPSICLDSIHFHACSVSLGITRIADFIFDTPCDSSIPVLDTTKTLS